MAGPQYRQKLQPRAKDFKGLAPYNPERKSEYFKEPYEPDFTKEPTQPWNLMPGLGMIEKGKDIYNKFRPELNDDMFNFNLGNWNFGVGKDKFGFGYSVPFQKTAGGSGAKRLGKGKEGLIEGLKDKFRWGLTEEEKQYLDTPLREPSGIGFGGEIVDEFRANNPEATIQDLYNYLEEQGRSFQPGDMLDPGDWYNWGEDELMEYSI